MRGKKKHGESLLEYDPAIVKLKVIEKHAETLGHVDNRREEPRNVSEAEVPEKKETKGQSCHQSRTSWG